MKLAVATIFQNFYDFEIRVREMPALLKFVEHISTRPGSILFFDSLKHFGRELQQDFEECLYQQTI